MSNIDDFEEYLCPKQLNQMIEIGQNLGKQDYIFELINLFEKNVKSELSKIRAYLANNQHKDMLSSLHTIIGSGSNLGFKKLTEVAKTLQSSIHDNKLSSSQFEQHIDTIDSTYTQSKELLRNRFKAVP